MSSPSRLKIGCSPAAHDDVEIAGRCAHGSGVAATGQTNALAIARAGLDANLQRLAALDAALAVAGRADGAVLAAAAAARTRHVELHAAALLRDLALAVALRTFARLLDVTLAVTVAANFQARNVELQLGAVDGLPEADVHLVFEVGTRPQARCAVSTPPPRPKMLEKMSRNPPPYRRGVRLHLRLRKSR